MSLMTAIDIRTAFLIIGGLYLLLPVITWLVLSKQQSLQVVLWCGGGVLVGLGLVIVGLQSPAPSATSALLISVPVSVLVNATLVLSHWARIESLRLDLGLRRRTPVMTLAVATAILGIVFADLGLHNSVLRAQLSSAVHAAFLSYLSMLAWRIGRGEQSRNAKLIAGVYALVVLAFLYRLTMLWASDINPVVLVSGNSSQLMAIAALISSVIGHFSYVGLALDRSRRREVKAAAEQAREEESRRLGAQIAQLDRQRSLGELSASLAHELNQPLTAILTSAQAANRGLQLGMLDAQLHVEHLDRIVRNTHHARKIVENIRGFIRPSASLSVVVNLNSLVNEVAALVAEDASGKRVSFVLPPIEPPVRALGDPIQIAQIVLNVYRNAMEAVAGRARREIRVSCRSEHGRAVCSVRDTGSGLSADALAQIGLPFFTTKQSGLGLGIVISRSIAAMHGGALRLANAMDEEGGVVVELDLPAHSHSSRAVPV